MPKKISEASNSTSIANNRRSSATRNAVHAKKDVMASIFCARHIFLSLHLQEAYYMNKTFGQMAIARGATQHA